MSKKLFYKKFWDTIKRVTFFCRFTIFPEIVYIHFFDKTSSRKRVKSVPIEMSTELTRLCLIKVLQYFPVS